MRGHEFQHRSRRGAIWLELALVIAVVTLVLQLFFPATHWWLISRLDVRYWSRLEWFVANVVLIGVLVAIRMAPEIKQSFADRKLEAAKRRKRAARRARTSRET